MNTLLKLFLSGILLSISITFIVSITGKPVTSDGLLYAPVINLIDDHDDQINKTAKEETKKEKWEIGEI
jgi:hypothetical protein